MRRLLKQTPIYRIDTGVKKTSALLSFLLIVLLSLAQAFSYWQPASAANSVIRPDGDVGSSGFTATGSTCSGGHWCTIDDAVTDPTAGDFTDNINASNNGNNSRVAMTSVTNLQEATSLTAKVYTDATGGSNNMQASLVLYVNET